MDLNSFEWYSVSEFYYFDEIDENMNIGNIDK